MKIVGVQEVRGEYNGSNYHNVVLHCLDNSEKAIGQVTEKVKVKYSDHKDIFGKEYQPSDWKALVGKNIIPHYDKYGKCNDIRFCENKA